MAGGDKAMTKTEIKYIVMSYVRSGDWQTTVVGLRADPFLRVLFC